MNLSNLFSNINSFHLNEFMKNIIFLSCKQCSNNPEIFMKDNENIILECKYCSIKKEEKISNIFNCSSEWIKNKNEKLCISNHDTNVVANIFCKTCNSFLCNECFEMHKKEQNFYHNYIKVEKLKMNFCNYHNKIFSYYCEQCDVEFCQKCFDSHFTHKYIDYNDKNNIYNEILNYNYFEKYLENVKNVQKNKFTFSYEIALCLQYLITDNRDLKQLLNNTISEILIIFFKDMKLIQNLIFLSKIIFFTFKISSKKQALLENYNNAFNYIKMNFQNDEIDKFKNSILPLKEEYESFYKKILKDKIYSEKDKERLEKLKKEILQRQKEMRKNFKINNQKITDLSSDSEKEEKILNVKLNNFLEDMCIYGNILEKEVYKEKEENPEKFIETKEALSLEKEDQDLFILGLLSQNLENEGVEAVIEKEDHEDEEEAGITSLQFITSGLYKKKRYDLHFEFGEERNDELLYNDSEYEKFKQNLKLKLSKDYNIPVDKIIVTFPQRGSFHVQVIFQSDEFNNLNEKEFLNKFKNDSEFDELKNLKEIHSDVLLKVCKLSRKFLDKRGNRVHGWGINEQRGNKPYYPPIGWIGIGLNVMDKYDEGNTAWLGYDGSKGEWCVAYHGVGRKKENNSDDIKKIIGKIYEDTFKVGENQVYEHHEDMFHKGRKVGKGVYCSPYIDIAEGYSGVVEINKKKYRAVLMVRVKPSAIRCYKEKSDYWIVNGTTDEIRPYRILYKDISK